MTWVTQQLLDAVASQRPGECITEERMAELTGLSAKQVENSVLRLRRHGFMVRLPGRGCHSLTEAGAAAWQAGVKIKGGPKGPQATGQRMRDPGLRQRVWNALRLGRKTSVDEIVMLVVRGSERDPSSNIGKYLRALARAGYLRRMPFRERPENLTSNGAIRWLLEKDTGPVAPVWRQSRNTLFDPNIETEIPLTESLAPVAARGQA